ncbi:hypothetical protein ABS755_07980 [Castellaniella sp. FW104-16D08]|uniref:hypothetical protein n=1 Tax=unclassified Castellaniella TaxID=2617606 RepID=UPI003315A309
MKYIAVIANIALLVFVAYGTAQHGAPNSTEDQVLVTLLLVVPLLNLLALWRVVPAPEIIRLFLKRKALEEQQKIDALSRS